MGLRFCSGVDHALRQGCAAKRSLIQIPMEMWYWHAHTVTRTCAVGTHEEINWSLGWLLLMNPRDSWVSHMRGKGWATSGVWCRHIQFVMDRVGKSWMLCLGTLLVGPIWCVEQSLCVPEPAGPGHKPSVFICRVEMCQIAPREMCPLEERRDTYLSCSHSVSSSCFSFFLFLLSFVLHVMMDYLAFTKLMTFLFTILSHLEWRSTTCRRPRFFEFTRTCCLVSSNQCKFCLLLFFSFFLPHHVVCRLLIVYSAATLDGVDRCKNISYYMSR